MFIKTLRAAGAGLAAIVLVNGQLLRAESSSLTCDFSGQKWTLRKSSGGQNGWAHSSDEILDLERTIAFNEADRML